MCDKATGRTNNCLDEQIPFMNLVRAKISKTQNKMVQHDDQDTWSIFFSFLKNILFFENPPNRAFSQQPSLGTILNQSGVKVCSSYVVSNLTLTYSKAQT